MKSFKFLGALALLTGAMLVATSCNKKDNEPTSGQFPTLNEILGSWIFDEIPEGWEGFPGVDLAVEDVYVFLGEHGEIYMGALQNYIRGEYSYSAADGQLTITVKQLPMDIPNSVATLTKGPGADQLTISIPLAGSTTVTKVCDKNYLLGECKDEPVDPEDPEQPEAGSHPTALDLQGTWHFISVPQNFSLPFPGVDPTNLLIWFGNATKATLGTVETSVDLDYTYNEENGQIQFIYHIPTDGSNYELEGTLAYNENGDLVCTLSQEAGGGEIVIHKECDGNMFEGDCMETYPAELTGSWEVTSELPKQLAALASMLGDNDAIIFFSNGRDIQIGVAYAGIPLLSGEYDYTSSTGNLDVTLDGFNMDDAVVTEVTEGIIQIDWVYDGNPVSLELEFVSQDNVIIQSQE